MGELSGCVIPAPLTERKVRDPGCAFRDLLYLEFEPEIRPGAEEISRFWQDSGLPRLQLQEGRQKKGPVHRIRLLTAPELAREEYTLEIRAAAVNIRGGSPAGTFYGVQSFLQIAANAVLTGGMSPILPAGILRDKPRFSYRGIMLDSARHFQSEEVICSLLDQMARFKYNIFHWHLTDRQGWRLPLTSFPELTLDMPPERSYSAGSYKPPEIARILAYAKARFITVIPEIEMPGHSAAVFRTHPELACPCIQDPFGSDTWEFCIGSRKTAEFLEQVLLETMALFPDSPWIHIGGDEASDRHWKTCPVCQAAFKKFGAADFREMEHLFLASMEKKLRKAGRQGIIWDSGYTGKWRKDCALVRQNYLDTDPEKILRFPTQVVNSPVASCYFDYPLEPGEELLPWIRKSRDFDPACGSDDPRCIGGEGCVWTEKIPEWRTLGRVLPRLRALSEALWSRKRKPAFADYRKREALLLEHRFFGKIR